MLDAYTLRIAFGAVAVCVFFLAYFATYRGTRSSYSGWWCLAMLAIGPGALLFVFNGTPLQVVTNPLGGALTTLGSMFILAACRSLSGRRLPVWAMVLVPLAVVVPTALGDPGGKASASDGWLLLVLGLVFAASCVELLRLRRTHRSHQFRTEYRTSVNAMVVAAGVLALFYGARAAFFVALGPDDDFYVTWFGPGPAALVLTVLLVATSASLTTLSYGERAMELHARATRDPLTGVLNRDGLAAVTDDCWTGRSVGMPHAVILADLDHFKEVNDTHGHQAGDDTLVAFARAAQEAVAGDGVVARLGGDEFLMLVRGVDPEEVVAAIDQSCHASEAGHRWPTVSYGITDLLAGEDLTDAFSRADRALYRAKEAGRGRSVRLRA